MCFFPAWAGDLDKHKEIKYHSAPFYPSTYVCAKLLGEVGYLSTPQ